MGVVGWGMMGPGNTDAFLGMKDVQVVAACDLDKNHLQHALNKINSHYGNKDCKAYHDYRKMMARKDIDAVMLAVPDHWHALVAVEAAKHKKDIYGEKPLARTIAEQQAIVKAVQQNQRIWQTGSWQRSQAPFRKACEIVRNGLIGKVTRVEVGLPERPFGFCEDEGQDEHHAAAGLAGLPVLDRAVADGAVYRGAGAHELALELQHGRGPVAGLGGAPRRHRALGAGL